MASYFNKTRGIVTVSLRNGESAVIGPKKTFTPTPEQDRSASLLSRVRKGLLIELKSKPLKPSKPSKPAPEPEKEPVVEPPPFADEPEDGPEGEPSMRWTKGQLTDHAELLGLDVSSSWTKVEILEAIEEAG